MTPVSYADCMGTKQYETEKSNERETETQRERERETERARQTDKQTDKNRDGGIETERVRTGCKPLRVYFLHAFTWCRNPNIQRTS